ncbi:16S rRNA (cytidine(1402)-2'-O)-methyltransferase [Candidatus Bipolaricaulota bacterium]|nr:16S rRNA (cytidine(1402)-2'-O)-methyltransferase [Candidatus Bipolaricaulota bacterium]
MNKGEADPGKLFVVGTPIGNLADITYRAVETLREVDAIIAEDSRHSQKLLDHYDIDTPFTLSYYQGAGADRRERLIEKLLAGQDLALISDAGTPLISDPGFKLVRKVRKRGVEVVGIPGPNAAITCLSISGQPTNSFTFDGQAPKKEGKKRKYFGELRTRTRTTVIYDSPHRIERTLELLDEVLPERSITVCRELTKEFEQTIKGTPAEVLESLSEGELKGEFTIVIRGATEEEAARARREEYEDVPIEDQYEGLKKLKGLSRKEAMKELARIRGVSKRDIYEELNE